MAAPTDVLIWSGTEWVSIRGPQGLPGGPGADGPEGPAGAAATVAVGTTTTAAPGGNAGVTNTGTASAAVLNFTIPRGADGADGPAGADGTPATISVGPTVTGAAGTQASVVNTGTPSAAVFAFTVPAGEKGDKGDAGSGVTIQGTATTFPPTYPSGAAAAGDLWLVGDPVPAGSPAGSQPGDGIVFDGTAWANVGPIRGPAGPAGTNGTAATVAVGTTTTGPVGSQSTVTNTGTASAAVFAFTIPRGDTGEDGAAATVAVGNTLTGVAGSVASVVNTGTASAAVLEFTIPRGDDGPAGPAGDDGENWEVYSQLAQPTAKRTGALWLVQ